MTFECFECLKALTSPITCGFRSLIIPSLREGTYNYLIKGGGRVMRKELDPWGGSTLT